MKKMQKYFLALVPPPAILEKAEEIKAEIRDQFGIKYALKSPAHITLKMPFVYNEAKEQVLIEKLNTVITNQNNFSVSLGGVRTFGRRVIYIGVEDSQELLNLQEKLRVFFKQELHLNVELSDSNYHPHMTLAFKDIKEMKFDKVLELVKSKSLSAKFNVDNIALLKRIDGKWILHHFLPFGS